MKQTIISVIVRFILIILIGEGLHLSARKIAVLNDYYRVPFVVVDKEQVYIWDQGLLKITIYSRQGYKKIAEFGRRGQGPGEFIGISAVNVDGDYIYVSSFPKVCIFTKGGKLEEEIKGPSNAGGFIPCDGNFVGTVYMREKHLELKLKMRLALYDSDLEKIVDLKEVDIAKAIFYKNGRDNVNMIVSHVGAECYGDKIIIGEPYRGFFFSVFDKKGRKLHEFEKKFTVRQVTEADRKRVLNLHRKAFGEKEWQKNKAVFNFYFPDVYPAFKTFSVSGNKIYVFDFPCDEKYNVYVFDLKGNPMGTIIFDAKQTHFFVEYGRYSIHNGKLYYPYENQDEEQWELHEVDLDVAVGK